MPTHVPSTHTTADDEIDLRELACTLWKNKGTVIAITALTTALAAGYAYTATPVYQTTMGLLPPPPSALIEFNTQPVTLSPVEAANLLFYYLSANATKTEFSAAVMPKHAGIPQPSISTSQQATGQMAITLASSKPEQLTQLAESYLNLAANAAKKEYNLRLHATRKALQEKLEQDLVIATEIAASPSYAPEITDARNGSVILLRNQLLQAQNKAKTAIDIPLYTVDTPAATPTAPIKPKKQLIIALGVVLGGMLGVFLVLIRQAFRRP